MTYVHDIRVRYGELDMQRVVFNAHYPAFCDDAIDSFDVGVVGTADGIARFDTTITYVSVIPGAPTPARIPDIVRERLS